ncbi:hypothetical protein [uncultured Tolumonas sp.]|uniref:hypothetical protein n=1 Tax=uncultured Tolumonas sp. TaxID=263765 RepID=UPI002A0A5144|nr:hypothetical protein [uncultured Tolumonas sp.]
MSNINHQIRRCAKINSAVFDIVYEDMYLNDEVKSIHAVVLASCIDSNGELKLSPWIPASLVPHVHKDDNLWFVTLSLTPAAMKYFIHSDNVINFECRIQNVVTRISFCTDQLIGLNGLNGKELVDAQPFNILSTKISQLNSLNRRLKKDRLFQLSKINMNCYFILAWVLF